MARRNIIEFVVQARDQASPELRNVESRIQGIGTALARVAGIIGAGIGVREIAQTADTYRLMENRIRLVTRSTQELRAVQDELNKVSLRTRSSFEATTNLYARVARSSRELGLSQQELLEFTETVNQTIQVSGSTAAEASAGVIQFGQALASSRLSGDELRSVLEQMPRLAQAIAEGLGTNIGVLREWGEEGKLTADRVIAAIQSQANAIESEFQQIIPPVSQALNNLQTAFVNTVGIIDNFVGASAAISTFIVSAANSINLLGRAMTGALDPSDKLTSIVERLAIALLVATSALKIFGEALVATSKFVAVATGEIIGALFAAIRQGISGNTELISGIGQDVSEVLSQEFTAAFGDLGNTIELDVIDLMERIGQIIGTFPRMMRDAVDLGRDTGGVDIIPRSVREAIEDANNKLFSFQNRLLDQVQAYNAATSSGRSYEEELQKIQLRALGAAADNAHLAENIIMVVESFNDTKKAAEDAAQALEDRMAFMRTIADQAARNIQDSFADFLFDPFDKGVKGMLAGFLVAIRRMLAEALAFQILTGLFANTRLAQFLPKRAAGGPVTAGQPVLVGERGPEIFTPGASGRITSNAAMGVSGGQAMGGFSPITKIDARGADPGLIARLPRILDERDRKLLNKVQRFLETGEMPV